jgi:hypothetical protein
MVKVQSTSKEPKGTNLTQGSMTPIGPDRHQPRAKAVHCSAHAVAVTAASIVTIVRGYRKALRFAGPQSHGLATVAKLVVRGPGPPASSTCVQVVPFQIHVSDKKLPSSQSSPPYRTMTSSRVAMAEK